MSGLKYRKQFNRVLIGGNGSGKTTLEIEIMIDYAKKNKWKRQLLLVPDDGEDKFDDVEEIEATAQALRTFTGIKKIIVEDVKIFDLILQVYTDKSQPGYSKFNGLLICDDMGVMLSRRPEQVIKLFKRRRQANIDFLWAFHGLSTDVPKSFWGYVSSLILLQTSDNHEDTMKKLALDKQAEFLDIYKRVQVEAKRVPWYCEELILRELT